MSRLPQLALAAHDAEMHAFGRLHGPEVQSWREALLELIAAAKADLDRLGDSPEPPPPPDVLLLLAERLASEHGEDVLIVRNPTRLPYQECNPSPYVVLASVASTEEVRVGVRVKPLRHRSEPSEFAK